MGIIRMGIPEELTLFIKGIFNADTFIETGTYYGSTTLWAASHFKKTHTIELSKDLFEQTSAKYSDVKNIDFHYGDTRNILKEILLTLHEDEKIILWLDAHWSAGVTSGEDDQCPLLQELDILVNSGKQTCILIDDARLFTAPPPLPNDYKQYPGIQEIVKIIGDGSFVTIYEDVIVVIPNYLKDTYQKFLQLKATENWNVYMDELKKKNKKKNIAQRVVNKIGRTLKK